MLNIPICLSHWVSACLSVCQFVLSCDNFHTITVFFQAFAMPSSTVLLPDPLPVPYQPPYTLVLEMSDVMVHAEYEVRCWLHGSRAYVHALVSQTDLAAEIWMEIQETPWFDSVSSRTDTVLWDHHIYNRSRICMTSAVEFVLKFV